MISCQCQFKLLFQYTIPHLTCQHDIHSWPKKLLIGNLLIFEYSPNMGTFQLLKGSNIMSQRLY